jgi:hypothetical protein
MCLPKTVACLQNPLTAETRCVFMYTYFILAGKTFINTDLYLKLCLLACMWFSAATHNIRKIACCTRECPNQCPTWRPLAWHTAAILK